MFIYEMLWWKKRLLIQFGFCWTFRLDLLVNNWFNYLAINDYMDAFVYAIRVILVICCTHFHFWSECCVTFSYVYIFECQYHHLSEKFSDQIISFERERIVSMRNGSTKNPSKIKSYFTGENRNKNKLKFFGCNIYQQVLWICVFTLSRKTILYSMKLTGNFF